LKELRSRIGEGLASLDRGEGVDGERTWPAFAPTRVATDPVEIVTIAGES